MSNAWVCCLMCNVWYTMSDVWCLVFHFWGLMSDMWCLMYYVSCLILLYDVRCLMFALLSKVAGCRQKSLPTWLLLWQLSYLSNTPTNLYMALLNFLLFCFLLYCYASVQYCNVKTIQYNVTHKFVGVLDNPHNSVFGVCCPMSVVSCQTSDSIRHWISDL